MKFKVGNSKSMITDLFSYVKHDISIKFYQ